MKPFSKKYVTLKLIESNMGRVSYKSFRDYIINNNYKVKKEPEIKAYDENGKLVAEEIHTFTHNEYHIIGNDNEETINFIIQKLNI